MTAKIIDGKEFASDVRAQVAKQVLNLKNEHNIIPVSYTHLRAHET